ncbi:Ltp family lipoprotein [Myceligenerans salitolerans]|uniref:Ltp family lipoprotein n=1 Tax=Myceligenerans salitolerans TaxID=1230528 RepID=UPI002416BE2A|nr:Ltp family lipoprotein [Myceligenerans salitolerans]
MPPYGPGSAAPATNGFATASLVLGIVSLVTSLLFLPAIVGVVLGFVGLNRAGRTNPPVGKGKAITGIALSAAGLLLGIGLVNLFGAMSDDVGEPEQDAVVQEEPAPEGDEQAEDGAEANTGGDSQNEKEAEPADDGPESAPDEEKDEKPAEEASNETVSQANARETAENYLNYTAFSKPGLIEQLEFEGFSKADSKYAVENIEVDWMEQAAKAAENYMDYSSFSRSGLIDQLEFEGFTPEQAAHGADSVGL